MNNDNLTLEVIITEKERKKEFWNKNMFNDKNKKMYKKIS